MRTFLIFIVGSFGLWITENVTIVLQIIITLVTIGCVLYERKYRKDRCRDCLYYKYYKHIFNKKKDSDDKGNEK